MYRESSTSLYFRADPDVPITYWEQMNLKEKQEFLQLRDQFHQNQKVSMKDRRLLSFANELQAVLEFTEKSDQFRENKCILIGIAFAGPFICVNTRQLKTFLGRCKSSINGSLQQLGYVALRTKSKARNCVLSVLPALSNESNLLRQWSVRCASEDAKLCYLSRHMPDNIPAITDEDLFDDKKHVHIVRGQAHNIKSSANIINQFNQAKILPKSCSEPEALDMSSQIELKPLLIPESTCDFVVPPPQDMLFFDGYTKNSDLTTSFSVGNIAEFSAELDMFRDSIESDWDSSWDSYARMPRSKSAFLQEESDVFLI